MKMIMAIVNRDDERPLCEGLMKKGFAVTKISSTGGILKTGNTTLISIVNTERLPKALEIIRNTVKENKYSAAEVNTEIAPSAVYSAAQQGERREVVVGGATVFVLNVEESYKF